MNESEVIESKSFLNNIPNEYKDLYESLNPSGKNELNEQAKNYNGMDTLTGIRSFFKSRDFQSLSRNNAKNSLNESLLVKKTEKGGLALVTDFLKPY